MTMFIGIGLTIYQWWSGRGQVVFVLADDDGAPILADDGTYLEVF